MSQPRICGPGGAASDAAHAVAARFYSPALFNHCVFARSTDLDVDDELLYVGSMLHDIALSPELDAHATGFDDASGHVAWVLATGLGWWDERRARLVEVVLAHMCDDVDAGRDPEGHVLERSTSWDISGRHQDDLPADFVDTVLAAWPRLGIAEEFIACFEEQGRRKPDSSAAAALRDGIAGRIASNPLDRR
jgi:hypothetical protein